MKGLEITGENLEDLLAYDDLFLDYFNAFLALPVFPQALVYNRLTGAFEEVEEEPPPPELLGPYPALNPATQLYGPTEAEREKMLEWARQERLPLFLKTQLFRELKLVKQLLRPLEERPSASRGSSRNLRGYSRQTDTYVSSLDDSGQPRSLGLGLGLGRGRMEDVWAELNYPALYRYQRPGSCALSLPIKCVHDDFIYLGEVEGTYQVSADTGSSLKTFTLPESRLQQVENPAQVSASGKRAARISNTVQLIPPASYISAKTKSSQRTKGPPASSTEEAFKRGARALSAPVSQNELLDLPPLELPDFDVMFGEEEPEPTGQAYVTFEDDHVSEEQTETEVRNLEGRLQMTLQQMKEHVLFERAGFQQFCEFLKDTTGKVLLDFWLDCENFKDTMEDFDDNKQREIATMLYRDIQDKYKLRLTQDAKEQISRSTSNMGLSHTIFLRTQYDVLRRLRAYWLPRYLTHCECTNAFDIEPRVPEPVQVKDMKAVRPTRSQPAIFPTISLVHSMPVLPEEARNFSFSQTRGAEGQGSRRATSSMSLRSARSLRSSRQAWFRRSLTSATIRSTKDRFLLSLAQDRVAGGPFQRFLSRPGHDPKLLSSLLFWQDVTEYGATEDRSADRLLRLCHAWSIYSKFLSEDSPHSIGIVGKEALNLHKTLQTARDFIEASIFDTAKTLAVAKLEKAWIRYLKEDLKAFLDCRVRVGGESPPSTADAIEITVTDQEVVIKRPRPWVRRLQEDCTPSARGRRLQKALQLAEDIDDERKAQKRREALERRKIMERERRKAIKAAYARQKEARKKKVIIQTAAKKASAKEAEEGGAENVEAGEGVKEEEKEKKGTAYVDLVVNKQVMTMFRKYLNEYENSKPAQNLVQLYQDIDGYFNTKDATKQKKESIASHIFKTFFDPQSKKYTEVSDHIAERVSGENERPKSSTLREIQGSILPKVEEAFAAFLNKRATEMGVSVQELANMSPAEMSMRMDSDTSLYTGWQKAGFKGQSRGKARGSRLPTGRSQPSREDKNEFLHALGQSAAGQPTMLMLYFYKYVLKHGEEDGMPLLDKDLFFYIEVQKFKDCSHAHSDEEMMKRKVQSTVDCFLDSVYSPSLQIDISSEIHTKTMKAAQRYMTGKEVVASLFDEAQYYVFKELLPYWAGFRRSQHYPDDLRKRPMTKHEKLLQKRQETIQNYQMPSKDIHLPRIPEGGACSYTITLSDGVKCRQVSESPAPSPVPELKEHRGSRLIVAPSMESLSKRGRRTSTVSKDHGLLSR